MDKEKVFYNFSNGIKSNRSNLVFDYNKENLGSKVKELLART